MSKGRDIPENSALARRVATHSHLCALGWCARSPHLTTTDAQRAAVRLGK
jgi:hypothetical protein